jgi:XTP/dITP diphosphohydrolase
MEDVTEDLEKIKSMFQLVIATGNKNKVIEIKSLLDKSNVQIVEIQGEFDPEETGNTFEENAYIKAYEAAKMMNLPALADDSGLVVDALNGMPGIYSARYAENTELRIQRVLNELKDFEPNKRTARFVCSMVIVNPAGEVLFSGTGTCEGLIIGQKIGLNGFGYDPIFFIPELNKTMAELSLEEKNIYSHRGKALKSVINWLNFVN